MSTTDTQETARSARLEARVSEPQKRLLQQAAALSGRTLSEFVVTSAQEAAQRVIDEHETIRLARADQEAFVRAVLEPAAPNERLQRAAHAYRKRLGL
jgi:uncharacterized protein (DUF1778 family)